MEWREAARDAIDDIREDGLRGGIHDLERDYRIDQRELGKLLIISSLALMTVAIPAAITMQQSLDTVSSATDSLDSAQAVMGSNSFQRSLQNLKDAVNGNLGNSVEEVSESVNRTGESVRKLEDAEQQLESRTNTFRWLSLISIVGLVAGISVIYV